MCVKTPKFDIVNCLRAHPPWDHKTKMMTKHTGLLLENSLSVISWQQLFTCLSPSFQFPDVSKSWQSHSPQIMKEEFSKGLEGNVCFYFIASENALLPSFWENANVTDDNLPFCRTSFYLDLNRGRRELGISSERLSNRWGCEKCQWCVLRGGNTGGLATRLAYGAR